MKFLSMILKIAGNLRNILTLVILTRLLFLENMQGALFLEILSGMAILIPTQLLGGEDIDHD
jgi:hypothetical protein